MAVEDYITIPELPEATSLQNTDLFPYRDMLAGVDKHIAYSAFKTGIINLFRDFGAIYDNTKSYKINAVVEDITTGILYKSLVDNNNFVLTDATKWKKLGDLSLIEEYLTIFNMANKLLKLNSNGLIDNALLKNQYTYSGGIVGNQASWYEYIYNADGTVNKLRQGGQFQATTTQGVIVAIVKTFPIAFQTKCTSVSVSVGFPANSDITAAMGSLFQTASNSNITTSQFQVLWANNATGYDHTLTYNWTAEGI